MIKKIIEFLKSDLAFILSLFLFFIICNIDMDYYITVGGGISDASSRIKVEDKYKSKGSFNISYVSQLDGNLLTYVLSYIIPYWEREDASDYKYTKNETTSDIDNRSDLYLDTANSTATYWAYTLAEKDIKLKSSKSYIIAVLSKNVEELKVGDEVVDVDGIKFTDFDSCRDYIMSKKVGDELTVNYIRNKKNKSAKVKVYEEDGKNYIGIVISVKKDYKVNPDLEINFKNSESGSSAGLITTLEIYNQLTKKDITNGYTIAGTGTIEEDGSIGQIGGIEHKILGAVKGKADIFLCPGDENYKEAKKYIKSKKYKIKLIKVDTIEDAINKLEALK